MQHDHAPRFGHNSAELTADAQGLPLAMHPQAKALIEQRMQDMTARLCTAFGMTADFEFHRNYPPTINSAPEAGLCRQVMADIVGADKVQVQEPTMGAEDFSFMLLQKPGCYAFIANGDGAHREMGHGGGPCKLHNASYDFNDALLPLGATYWVRLANTA